MLRKSYFNLFLFAATVNILAIAITGGLWIAGKIPEGNYAFLRKWWDNPDCLDD